MKIFDVSLPITSSMMVWPGDPGVRIDVKTTVAKHGVKLSYFSFGSHTGTHIDAPSHFVKDGVDLDKVSLKKFIGECQVIDLTRIEWRRHPGKRSHAKGWRSASRIPRDSGQARMTGMEILPIHLEQCNIKEGERLLFKTGNFKLLHKKTFPDSYISLSLEASALLAKKKVNLVGTDFLGIEKRKNPGHPVHTTLLAAGIVIVEGLDLSKVPAGRYQLFCLPLNVVGVDGAPARVILMS